MNSGSRPMARMARTGEFTPPGRRSTARRYSSADFASVRETVTASDARDLALPVLEVVREVEEADLLELGGAVQRGAVTDAVDLRRDRVEDRVALLLGPPVGHREDGVLPVLVGRALVAVRDPAVGRHQRADLGDAVLRDLPHAHAVGAEAGAAVEEDRGDAAEQPALLHADEVVKEALNSDAELARGVGVRLGDHGQVALRGENHRTVEVVVGLLAELDGLLGDARGGERLRVARHLE